MSYTISISGHKDDLTPDESAAFDADVVAKASQLAGELEGVTFAQVTTGSQGTVNVLETP